MNFIKEYKYPLICLVLLIVIAFLTFRDIHPTKDHETQIEQIQKKSDYWEHMADSLAKRIEVRYDTLKVVQKKTIYKDRLIYVKQDSVMALPNDSGVAFLIQWSGQPVIKD